MVFFLSPLSWFGLAKANARKGIVCSFTIHTERRGMKWYRYKELSFDSLRIKVFVCLGIWGCFWLNCTTSTVVRPQRVTAQTRCPLSGPYIGKEVVLF